MCGIPPLVWSTNTQLLIAAQSWKNPPTNPSILPSFLSSRLCRPPKAPTPTRSDDTSEWVECFTCQRCVSLHQQVSWRQLGGC